MSRLPRLLVLTDRRQARRDLVAVVRAAVGAGADGVVVREKDLPRPERVALLERVVAAVGGREARVIAASWPGRLPHGVDGVHLDRDEPRPEPRPRLIGRSCHNAGELAGASAEGVDYVTLSPVFMTPSKPGYGPPLGLDGLARLAARAGVPVYALGGLNPTRAASCLAHGAAGIAVMGAIMRATDPGRVTADFVTAIGQAAAAVGGKESSSGKQGAQLA